MHNNFYDNGNDSMIFLIFLNNLFSAHFLSHFVKSIILINCQNIKHCHARRSKCPRTKCHVRYIALSEFSSLSNEIGIVIIKITDRHRSLSLNVRNVCFTFVSSFTHLFSSTFTFPVYTRRVCAFDNRNFYKRHIVSYRFQIVLLNEFHMLHMLSISG